MCASVSCMQAEYNVLLICAQLDMCLEGSVHQCVPILFAVLCHCVPVSASVSCMQTMYNVLLHAIHSKLSFPKMSDIEKRA